LVGILGLFIFKDSVKSKSYARATAILYAIIVVIGLIPGANTIFGTIPIYDNNV
jgi:uncharacterized membrane protein